MTLPRLPWPLPALLAWSLSWLLFAQLLSFELDAVISLLLASLLGVGLSVLGHTWWRRLSLGRGAPTRMRAWVRAGPPTGTSEVSR